MTKYVFWLISLATLINLGGCSEILYYSQATKGQLGLLASRQDISEILKENETDEKLKQRLMLLMQARQFAESKLVLPVGKAYLDYVDIEHPYVIWNITAAEEFSLSGYQWCYPIVGCQSYRGYFNEQDAREFATHLDDKGLETYVSGVDAYSTLGWFDDPVLSTFLKRSDESLAALLFHELAHRVVYIKGDTAFNESFATAVEQAGLKLWLEQQDKSENFQSFLDRKATYRQFINLVLKTNADLNALYKSDLSDDIKRARKITTINQLRSNYEQASEANSALKRYQHWINSDINNAKLITVANYHNHVDAFSRLLAENQFDFSAFYQKVEKLGALPKEEREKALASYPSDSN